MYLIRERFFRLGEDSDITDEHGRPVLHVDGKVLSLRNRLVLRDPEGREVAQVHRKLVAMRPTYQISIAGQQAAEVRKRLFTPFGDRFTIDVPGPDDLEMRGNLFDHEFTISRGGQTVATVSKGWFSMRDIYAVDVVPGQVALDPTGALVGPGDIRAQARQVFDNLEAALQAVGAGFQQVVKLTYYLVDATQLPVVREVRDQYVNTRQPPASTAVEVRRLVRDDLLLEVEAIAVIASFQPMTATA
jgi:uncharacterized protein YxjI